MNVEELEADLTALERDVDDLCESVRLLQQSTTLLGGMMILIAGVAGAALTGAWL